MTETTQRPAAPSSTMSQLTEDLQALRIRAGDISYGEISARITRNRQERGTPEAAARVARSTVYDVFRPDRRRLNAALLAEIVVALGEDDAAAERWRQRCIALRADAQLTPEVPRSLPSTLPAGIRLDAPVSRWPVLPPPRPEPVFAATLFIAALGLNLFGGVIVVNFGLSLFLDMVGTAIIAVCIGPWAGVAMALLTVTLGSFATSPAGVAFVFVSIVGALVWGYGIHRWRLGRTPLRFLLLNIATAVLCTLASAPISILVYHGQTEHANTMSLIAQLLAADVDMWQATLTANIGVSLPDKLISGYLALLVAIALARYGPTPRQRT